MKLILINGVPASGKSTLTKEISNRLGIVSFAKDDFKELAYEHLGHNDHDRAWSKVLSRLSIAYLHYLIRKFAGLDQTLMIDANLNAEIARKEIGDLINGKDVTVLEIHCYAEPHVLVDRYRKRAESGERHPGHRDANAFPSQEELSTMNGSEALGLGLVLEIDTTNGTDESQIDQVVKFIESDGKG